MNISKILLIILYFITIIVSILGGFIGHLISYWLKLKIKDHDNKKLRKKASEKKYLESATGSPEPLIQICYINRTLDIQYVGFEGMGAKHPYTSNPTKKDKDTSSDFKDCEIKLPNKFYKHKDIGKPIKKGMPYLVTIHLDSIIKGINNNKDAKKAIVNQYNKNTYDYNNRSYNNNNIREHLNLYLYAIIRVDNNLLSCPIIIQYGDQKYNYIANKIGLYYSYDKDKNFNEFSS